MRPIPDLTPQERLTIEDMNADFVKEFSEPLARILARSALSAKYGRKVVDSYDWLGLIIAVWGYHRDMGELRYRRKLALENKHQQAVTGSIGVLPNVQPYTPSQEPTNGQSEQLVDTRIAIPPGAY